jgi:hypothetical protein
MSGRDDVVRLLTLQIEPYPKVNIGKKDKQDRNEEIGGKSENSVEFDLDLTLMKLMDKIFGMANDSIENKRLVILKKLTKFQNRKIRGKNVYNREGKEILKLNQSKTGDRYIIKDRNYINPLHIFLHTLSTCITTDTPLSLIEAPTLFTGDTPISCGIRGSTHLLYPISITLPFPVPKFVEAFHILIPSLIKKILTIYTVQKSSLRIRTSVDPQSIGKIILKPDDYYPSSSQQKTVDPFSKIFFRNPLVCILPESTPYVVSPYMDWHMLINTASGIQAEVPRMEVICALYFVFMFKVGNR